MTSKEMEIIKHLKINPFISQQELAHKIGLSRSATANYIIRLTKKGIIKGRAYILQTNPAIVCIGSANVDINAYATRKVQLHSSNPVEIIETCGGVARNFAESCAKADEETILIACISDDKGGKWLLDQTKNAGVDVSHVTIVPGLRTGTFTELIDTSKDSVVSLVDNDIYKQLTPSILKEKHSQISNAKALFLDTNIPKESMIYLLEKMVNEDIPLFIDPVSPNRAENLPTNLNGTLLMTINKITIEAQTNIKINNEDDCYQACVKIHERGVENVIITLSNHKIFYSSKDFYGYKDLHNDIIIDKQYKYTFLSNLFLHLLDNISMSEFMGNKWDQATFK